MAKKMYLHNARKIVLELASLSEVVIFHLVCSHVLCSLSVNIP